MEAGEEAVKHVPSFSNSPLLQSRYISWGSSISYSIKPNE